MTMRWMIPRGQELSGGHSEEHFSNMEGIGSVAFTGLAWDCRMLSLFNLYFVLMTSYLERVDWR